MSSLQHDPVTYEPNDSPSTAAPITLGKEVASGQAVGDLIDYYSLTLDGQRTYTLQLAAQKFCGGTGLWVTVTAGKDGQRGQLLDRGAGTDTFTTLEAGVVLVAIEGCAADIPYTLTVTE